MTCPKCNGTGHYLVPHGSLWHKGKLVPCFEPGCDAQKEQWERFGRRIQRGEFRRKADLSF